MLMSVIDAIGDIMPRKFSIHMFKPSKPRLFNFRGEVTDHALILRIDILHKGIFVIYRKKALYRYLEDISYEYL